MAFLLLAYFFVITVCLVSRLDMPTALPMQVRSPA
jgi:hypothetical protein